MPSAREYLRNWLRWQRGRQGTGHVLSLGWVLK